MKKLPPFGKQLKSRMRSGYRPTNGVNIYPSWNMGHNYHHGITFPPDASPDDFAWSFLAGQRISLINTGGYADYEKLKALAILLVESGVKSVGLIDPDHSLHWYLPRSKAA